MSDNQRGLRAADVEQQPWPSTSVSQSPPGPPRSRPMPPDPRSERPLDPLYARLCARRCAAAAYHELRASNPQWPMWELLPPTDQWGWSRAAWAALTQQPRQPDPLFAALVWEVYLDTDPD